MFILLGQGVEPEHPREAFVVALDMAGVADRHQADWHRSVNVFVLAQYTDSCGLRVDTALAFLGDRRTDRHSGQDSGNQRDLLGLEPGEVVA